MLFVMYVGVQSCIDYPQNDSTKTNKEVHKVKEEDTSQILYIKKLREIIKSLRNNLSSKTRSLVRLKVVVNHLRNKLREKIKGETVHEKKRTQSNEKVSRVFRKGMRWTPEAKKQAIGLYLKSPAAYSAIRTQQFMNLPHKRTLLRTVHQLFEKVSRVYLLTYTYVSKINKLTLSFGAVQQNEGKFGSASVAMNTLVDLGKMPKSCQNTAIFIEKVC
jgi:hypothetical protein